MHYRFKRLAFSPKCCALLKNSNVQCSNTGIYVNGVNNYCGVHLHKLDREIEVYNLMVCEQGGYEPRVVVPCTTLRNHRFEEGDEACSVCMENITVNTGVLTQCGHSFHLRCFHTWNVALEKNTCPNCRETLRSPLEVTDDQEMFSLMDVIDDPRVREILSGILHPDIIRTRAFSYDEGMHVLEHDIMPFLTL